MRKEKPAVKEPFVVVYEPISDELSADLIESVDRIKLDPLGKESCAIKVKTKEGDTFTLVNILKDGPVILNNQKCCADFAIFS